jgi:hypothetical protein
MMRFASKLADKHNPAPATAIGVASQAELSGIQVPATSSHRGRGVVARRHNRSEQLGHPRRRATLLHRRALGRLLRPWEQAVENSCDWPSTSEPRLVAPFRTDERTASVRAVFLSFANLAIGFSQAPSCHAPMAVMQVAAARGGILMEVYT